MGTYAYAELFYGFIDTGGYRPWDYDKSPQVWQREEPPNKMSHNLPDWVDCLASFQAYKANAVYDHAPLAEVLCGYDGELIRGIAAARSVKSAGVQAVIMLDPDDLVVDAQWTADLVEYCALVQMPVPPLRWRLGALYF